MNIVSTCLQDAVNEGILEKRTTDGRMKFCHDKCWSYCYSMVQAGKARELLHWNIGHLLLQASTLPTAKGWMTVAAAEQLNRGSCQVTCVHDKVRMAKLNPEAADILCSNSAFLKASEYLRKGIVLLDSVGKKWEMHYDLALALHSASAEIEYSCGNLDQAKTMIEAVIANGQSFHCKLRLYHILVTLLSAEQNFEQAASVAFGVLEQLKEPIPCSPGKSSRPRRLVLMSVAKMKRKVRSLSDEQLLNLPQNCDADKIAVMKMFSSMVYLCWYLKRKDYYPFIALRMMEISLKYGLSAASCHGFAIYGALLAAKGTVQEGHRLGALATRLGNDKFSGTQGHTRAIVAYHAHLHHLQAPAHESLEPLHAAYTLGFECGDVMYGLAAASTYSILFYTCGFPIKALLEDNKVHCDLTAQYTQQTTLGFQLWSRHVYASLAGDTDEVAKGQEQIHELERRSPSTGDAHSLTFVHSCWARLNVAFIFGNWVKAKEMAGLLRKTRMSFPQFQCYSQSFLVGMTYAVLARKSGKRSYFRFARREQNRMHGWLEQGCQNCLAQYLLLSAELCTIKAPLAKIKGVFDEAIRVARRTGMTQIEAIGNERLGVVLLEKGEPEVCWGWHVERAHELYKEHGAHGKCADLESRFQGTLSNRDGSRSNSTSGTYSRGKALWSSHTIETDNIAFGTDALSSSLSRYRSRIQ